MASLSSALSRHSKATACHPHPPREVKLQLLTVSPPRSCPTHPHTGFSSGAFPEQVRVPVVTASFLPAASSPLLSSAGRSMLLLGPTLFPISFPADITLAPMLPRSFCSTLLNSKSTQLFSKTAGTQTNKTPKHRHPPLPVLPCRSPGLVTAASEGQDFGECGHCSRSGSCYLLRELLSGGGAAELSS